MSSMSCPKFNQLRNILFVFLSWFAISIILTLLDIIVLNLILKITSKVVLNFIMKQYLVKVKVSLDSV